MHKKSLITCLSVIIILTVPFLIGCSVKSSEDASASTSGSSPKKESTGEKRTTVHEYLLPTASGAVVYGNDIVSIDASNVSEGYIMIQYSGGIEKVRVQITAPDQTTYTYDLAIGSYETFPLSGGDGNYHIDILENAYDDMYAIAFSQDVTVTLNDEFRPFLYPNQYVWFTQDYQAVEYAAGLSDESSSDIDYVEQVYRYVTENISYDEELAANVKTNYLPNIDNTMKTKKGICFDYASLMAAMLRSQGVPTKLVVGYSGDAYHAWISVYLKEIGWVDDIIRFDGKKWSLIDPTLAANSRRASVKDYIGDGSKYTVKYVY